MNTRRSTIRALACAVASLLIASVEASAIGLLIAENDGSVAFTSLTYTNGLNTLGDANFVAANLASYDSLGSDAIIKLQMGSVVDYFSPTAGNTLLSMLTSFTQHTWSSSETGPFVTPDYYVAHLGGSAFNWPLINAAGDDREFLSQWGSNNTLTGGCCDLDYIAGQDNWGQAFTIELVPEPSTALLLGGGLVGLAVQGRRKKA